jgi:hypothetical protein
LLLIRQKYLKMVAVLLLLIGIGTSLVLDFYRVKAEQRNNTVEILVDYDELHTLAVAQHVPLQTVAQRFRAAGATGVVIRERSVEELKDSGKLVMLKGSELALQQSLQRDFLKGLTPVREHTYLLLTEQELFTETARNLQAKKTGVKAAQYGDWYVIALPLTLKEQEKLGVGFPHRELQEITAARLTVVPRIRSWGQAGPEPLDVLVESLQQIPGLSLLTFNDEVLPATPGHLAEKLGTFQVPVGLFEFYNQQGLSNLALLLGKKAVRVHCISENDMVRLNEDMALDRFNLAVSERNIRALYVRLFGMKQPEGALERGLSFISRVRENVQAEGLQVGPASQLPGLPYSRYLILAIGLGVLGGVLLLCRNFLPPGWTAAVGLVGLLGWVGLLYVQPLLARKAFALLAAVVFPVLAVITLVREKKRTIPETLLTFLQMAGISFLGAVLMTGLLADKSFMLKLDQFSGVKIAHLVPLLLVPLYFFWKKHRQNLRETVRRFLKAPLLVWYALAGVFLLAVAAIYLLRTGNEASALVSSGELWLRDTLDQLLFVRPRTKEFLIGHPLMVLLLYYGYTQPRFPLLFLGIIGQISLVNTYAHLHTPLLISLLRSFHGLWLGILLGLLLIAVVRFAAGWLGRRTSDG